MEKNRKTSTGSFQFWKSRLPNLGASQSHFHFTWPNKKRALSPYHMGSFCRNACDPAPLTLPLLIANLLNWIVFADMERLLTGLTFNGSGTRVKDVACPTCTVHLQVCIRCPLTIACRFLFLILHLLFGYTVFGFCICWVDYQERGK